MGKDIKDWQKIQKKINKKQAHNLWKIRDCEPVVDMQLVLDLGFHQLRVRIHGTLARIEVLPDELPKVLENREQIVKAFKEYGFTYVTMDLQGYRMGSMNETLCIKFTLKICKQDYSVSYAS